MIWLSYILSACFEVLIYEAWSMNLQVGKLLCGAWGVKDAYTGADRPRQLKEEHKQTDERLAHTLYPPAAHLYPGKIDLSNHCAVEILQILGYTAWPLRWTSQVEVQVCWDEGQGETKIEGEG